MKHYPNTIQNESEKMIIRVANDNDIRALIDHEIAHMQELGYNNLPAHPFPTDYPFDSNEARKTIPFSKDIKSPGWKRSIIALDEDKIIAHLSIGGNIAADSHRARIGMGIDAKYRGQGLGTKMINFAIEFCKKNQIEYIDLSVFAHNLPAIKLYKKCGFVEIGQINDCFRLNNLVIDDIQMTLKIN